MGKKQYETSHDKQMAFTIVELLIVIVVIGILAAIVIIAYIGVQKRAVNTELQSDLRNAASLMHIAHADTDTYPSALPSGVKTSPGVALSLAGSSGAVYSGLSSVQNGLLFYNICQKLVTDGVGAKPDDNHDYISSCAVYNKNQIHIDGWNGRDVNTPVTAAALQAYVSSYSGGQTALFTTHAGDFMNQLTSQFQASGGVFPVTSFWDSWATPTNGGVMKPTLPAPTGGGSSDPTVFCINATYDKDATVQWYITQNRPPTAGVCP